MLKTWKTLYKKSSSGKVLEWTIRAIGNEDGTAKVEVVHGQRGGKLQQSTVDIAKGKNIGKANETSAYEQAVSEANSKWKKQLDKGYSESATAEKPLRPMLAQKYSEYPEWLTFPCFWQPKLDGLRCLAYWRDDKIVLESRNGKHWSSMSHIADEIAKFLPENMILDGELYCHREQFQKIVGAIKRDKPSADSVKVEYHVYDIVEERWDFSNRTLAVHQVLQEAEPEYVKPVFTAILKDSSEIPACLKQAEKAGYEGIMLRNFIGRYEPDKRSYNLLKCKSFFEEEFEIIDVVEGKGKAKGCGIFVCKTKDGGEFRCMPEGSDELRRQYWADRTKLIGKLLTVKYFEMSTSEIPVPRFPIGKAVRDYE